MNLYDLWLQTLVWFDVLKVRQFLDTLPGGKEALFSMTADQVLSLGQMLSFSQMVQYEEMRSLTKLNALYESFSERGIGFVSEEDEAYPHRLRALPDRPFGLFFRGSLPDPDRPTAGIIGSRACTNYGKESAYFFGKELASKGVQIISGMALGVDGYAQRGAVSAEDTEDSGRSFAVLGGGADICYPRENIGLYESLLHNGHGILSERPPGYHSLSRDFPIRNRLIAALSDVLLVIEAAENSGSLITVNLALSQGKDVFALPGRIGDRQSRGCNELLKNGAQVLTCPEDVLQYLGVAVKKDTVKKSRLVLSREEKAVYDCLSTDMGTVDELLNKTALPLGTLQSVLLTLEIKGAVKKAPMGGYVRL